MENPIWKCKYNPMLSQGIDILGGPVEKTIIYFC